MCGYLDILDVIWTTDLQITKYLVDFPLNLEFSWLATC